MAPHRENAGGRTCSIDVLFGLLFYGTNPTHGIKPAVVSGWWVKRNAICRSPRSVEVWLVCPRFVFMLFQLRTSSSLSWSATIVVRYRPPSSARRLGYLVLVGGAGLGVDVSRVVLPLVGWIVGKNKGLAIVCTGDDMRPCQSAPEQRGATPSIYTYTSAWRSVPS